jgi:hypothetical protein
MKLHRALTHLLGGSLLACGLFTQLTHLAAAAAPLPLPKPPRSQVLEESPPPASAYPLQQFAVPPSAYDSGDCGPRCGAPCGGPWCCSCQPRMSSCGCNSCCPRFVRCFFDFFFGCDGCNSGCGCQCAPQPTCGPSPACGCDGMNFAAMPAHGGARLTSASRPASRSAPRRVRAVSETAATER